MVPGLSIVVPTHNRVDLLLRLLQSPALAQDAARGPLEVVVVVDGSSDGTAGRLCELEVPYRLLVLEGVHAGPANARNHGWQAASGDLLLFLDDNVLPSPQLVREHLASHAGQGRALVMGRLLPDPAQPATPWTDYEDAMRANTSARRGLIEQPSGLRYAGNFSVARTWLEDIGGFNPRLAGNQDIDLGFRLRERGIRFLFNPAAVAWQQARDDYQTWRQARVLEGRFDLAMYRDQVYAGGLLILANRYRRRRLLTRVAVAVALRHRRLERALLSTARQIGQLAYRLGMRSLARAAFSAVANVLYWGGVRDGLRGCDAFRRFASSGVGTSAPSASSRALRAAKRIASVRFRTSSLR